MGACHSGRAAAPAPAAAPAAAAPAGDMPTLLGSARGGSRAMARAQKEAKMEQVSKVEQKAEMRQAEEEPRAEQSPPAKPNAEVQDAAEDKGPWQELSSVGAWLESHSPAEMMTDEERQLYEYAMSLPLIKYTEVSAPPPKGGILGLCCAPDFEGEEVVYIEKLHL